MEIIWVVLFRRHWPAIKLTRNEVGIKNRPNHSWVFWFGDHSISEVKSSKFLRFEDLFKEINKEDFYCGGKKWLEAVIEAIRAYGHPRTEKWDDEQLRCWALYGFPHRYEERSLPGFMLIRIYNAKIEDNRDVLEKMEYNLRKYCLGCYSTNVENNEHPLFGGGICKFCKKKLIATYFNLGKVGIHQNCVICGDSCEKLVCSNGFCGRAFCCRCVENLGSPEIRMELLSYDHWLCFFCCEQFTYGNLTIRNNWRILLKRLFQVEFTPIPPMMKAKPKIRVLSVFDGISSALVALEACKFEVDVYFASEIHEYAVTLVKKRHGNTIQCIGDVKSIDAKMLESLGPIDLLIGGPPCNYLSLTNQDPRDTGETLFFEFYRIFEHLRTSNGKQFFWLFENLASISRESKATITRFLQSRPVEINTSWVSAVDSKRYFWGNLLSLKQNYEAEGPSLQKYLLPRREAIVFKTITTETDFFLLDKYGRFPVMDENSNPTSLTPDEIEKIFGFSGKYTKTLNFRDTNRIKLIAKGSSVQVLSMLFRFFKYFYASREEYLLES